MHAHTHARTCTRTRTNTHNHTHTHTHTHKHRLISKSCQTSLIMNLGIELIIKLSFLRGLTQWLLVSVCLLCVYVCVSLSAWASVCMSPCNHMPAQKHGNRSMIKIRWSQCQSKHFTFYIQYRLCITWPWPNHSVHGSLGSSQAVNGSWTWTSLRPPLPVAAFCRCHRNLAQWLSGGEGQAPTRPAKELVSKLACVSNCLKFNVVKCSMRGCLGYKSYFLTNIHSLAETHTQTHTHTHTHTDRKSVV